MNDYLLSPDTFLTVIGAATAFCIICAVFGNSYLISKVGDKDEN
ncbi:hypothetical protein [Lysinibacillus xylanilyticus]|nr:hypothetical protein [Lysinibacillus xylanilyticus]